MTVKYNPSLWQLRGLSKCKVRIFSLSTFLMAILTLLVFYRPTLDFTDNIILRTLFANQTELPDLSKLEADDENLIDLIKQHYLTEPSPPSERNLTTKIFNSAVMQYVHKLLKYKKNGFFVEVGANDGELLSNSLLLEVNHGWTGLLAEADPVPLQKLKRTHRNAWVASCCLSPEAHPKKVEMISHKRVTGWANIPNLYRAKITKGDFTDPFQVQCFPLYSLLLAVNRTEIDYFSLDIEGAELKVLETIPFDRVDIKVIGVETNNNTAQITKLLRSYGYYAKKRITVSGIDDTVFIKQSAF